VKELKPTQLQNQNRTLESANMAVMVFRRLYFEVIIYIYIDILFPYFVLFIK